MLFGGVGYLIMSKMLVNHLGESMNEVHIANAYTGKANNAKQSGHEFTLSFAQFKRLYLRKTCYYSGELLSKRGKEFTGAWNYPTYERIDASKGYIAGNVVVICHCLNSLKGTIESKESALTFDMVHKMLHKLPKS